jgi:hypothetical protein
MKDKTPDQIRRETVPNKHYGFMFGFFGAIFGLVLWFGGWALLHVEQARRYPEYCAAALKAGAGGTLFGTRPSQRSVTMTSAQLRYALLRYGNLDHRYDEEIIRHGWYPRQAPPAAWVARHGGIASVYNGESASKVFKWPVALTALTLLTSAASGMALDQRYRMKIISGIPFDGSILASVDEYNREVKGDGMRYRVKQWDDR